jgi:hypothetical protein
MWRSGLRCATPEGSYARLRGTNPKTAAAPGRERRHGYSGQWGMSMQKGVMPNGGARSATLARMSAVSQARVVREAILSRTTAYS